MTPGTGQASQGEAFSPQAAEDIGRAQWADAQRAAVILAINPEGLGGLSLHAGPGPVRDRWLKFYRSLLSVQAPFRKLPAGASEDRIIGGLDLAATLKAGRPIAECGVLAAADGGVLLAPMAERLSRLTAGHIANAMDQGVVLVERGGISRRERAQFSTLLFDEGLDGSERPPEILLDRLAFHLDLDLVSIHQTDGADIAREKIRSARARLSETQIPDEITQSINAACLSLGVISLRSFSFCINAAKSLAAFAGRPRVNEDDAEATCRLVLGPRAVLITPPEPEEDQSRREADAGAEDQRQHDDAHTEDKTLEDLLVATVRSAALGRVFRDAVPSQKRQKSAAVNGKSGALIISTKKGRPNGAVRGDPRSGGRLDLVATLRAAAPWRKIRGANDQVAVPVHMDDLHLKRLKARAETIVIFVIDASGSSAMHRMAEAKGAVELLLSDCYTRRDHVALIAFRGEGADLLLPPTRSLVRVRRSLSALPGGGSTPLAAGVAAAAALAETEKRKGKTPFVVFLSDGRGNIALDGEADRAAAAIDASSVARRFKEFACSVLFFDTSKRPNPGAAALCKEMGGAYRPLPFADSAAVSKLVKRAIITRD
ncbi:MAG: magnesium chelatase subunit D [Pseudomonadota bacterium]